MDDGRWTSWCPEPGSQRVAQSGICAVSHPGDISVGPNQHGGGSGDRAKYRKLPQADIFSVDQLDPIRPWSNVEAAGLTEVEQHRLGAVQQLEDSERAVGGQEVQIAHARAPSRRRVGLVPRGRRRPDVSCR